MNRLTTFFLFILAFSNLFSSCASAIVRGERIKTSSIELKAKPKDASITVFFDNQVPDREFILVGKVTAKAWLLDKGIEEIKVQARKLGADAVINITFEQKFSMDYLQDLYFLKGDCVIWK